MFKNKIPIVRFDDDGLSVPQANDMRREIRTAFRTHNQEVIIIPARAQLM